MKSIFFFSALIIASHTFAQVTFVPDINFESALITQGYDTLPLDGQVPTANISGLTLLDVSSKSISDLTGIEDFAALQDLDLGNNNLTSLDLSQNANLKRIFALYNPFSCINLRNGNNENIILFHAYQCPNLVCIQVDNSAYSDTTWVGTVTSPPGWPFVFDPNPQFSEYCDDCNVGLSSQSAAHLSIFPNPSESYFQIEGISGMATASIYSSIGQLMYFDEEITSSTKIDVSDFPTGLLIIRIEIEEHVFYHKVLKE